jgi:hypothetical protein
VVILITEDGVRLEAESHLSGVANSPAVVLLHMSPPDNDRSNYPHNLVQAFLSRGISVLNLDRRGAGASGGNPIEAYSGPRGKLDAQAAFTFYKNHPCPIDLDRIVYIGAGNGTTTVLDYTVHAATSTALRLPRALVFLTGGAYTENQNKISKNRALLVRLPMLLIYSDRDRRWSEWLTYSTPPSWEFHKYDGDAFGTEMFSAKPEAIMDVVEFVQQVTGP